MKQIDLTSVVMSKVARYERGRIQSFATRFAVLLLVVSGIIMFCLGIIVWQLIEMQAFDLLTLFHEDRQIIAEFWQDTLVVFWEQVPPLWFWGEVLSLVGFGGMLLLTRKRRVINKKKLSQLENYSKKL